MIVANKEIEYVTRLSVFCAGGSAFDHSGLQFDSPAASPDTATPFIPPRIGYTPAIYGDPRTFESSGFFRPVPDTDFKYTICPRIPWRGVDSSIHRLHLWMQTLKKWVGTAVVQFGPMARLSAFK